MDGLITCVRFTFDDVARLFSRTVLYMVMLYRDQYGACLSGLCMLCHPETCHWAKAVFPLYRRNFALNFESKTLCSLLFRF